MLVGKSLDTRTPVLLPNQSVIEAIEQMNRMEVSYLPIVEPDTNKLVGQIDLAQLRNADQTIKNISELHLQEPVKIFNNQHLFKAVHLMLMHGLSVLPVVTREWKYQGLIHKKHVLESLSRMLNINKYGSIITIELPQNDFTLTEIVHIIETEGGKILGVTVEPPTPESNTYEISIKLNLNDVSRVASSLRRHEYAVLTETKSDSSQLDLETRADELIKYLEV